MRSAAGGPTSAANTIPAPTSIARCSVPTTPDKRTTQPARHLLPASRHSSPPPRDESATPTGNRLNVAGALIGGGVTPPPATFPHPSTPKSPTEVGDLGGRHRLVANLEDA